MNYEGCMRYRLIDTINELRKQKKYISLQDVINTGKFSDCNQKSLRSQFYCIKKKLGVPSNHKRDEMYVVLLAEAKKLANEFGYVDYKKLQKKLNLSGLRLADMIKQLKMQNKWPFKKLPYKNPLSLKVEKLIVADPNLTSKNICERLNLNYSKNMRKISNLIGRVKKRYNLPTRRTNSRLLD